MCNLAAYCLSLKNPFKLRGKTERKLIIVQTIFQTCSFYFLFGISIVDLQSSKIPRGPIQRK